MYQSMKEKASELPWHFFLVIRINWTFRFFRSIITKTVSTNLCEVVTCDVRDITGMSWNLWRLPDASECHQANPIWWFDLQCGNTRIKGSIARNVLTVHQRNFWKVLFCYFSKNGFTSKTTWYINVCSVRTFCGAMQNLYLCLNTRKKISFNT